MFLVSLLVLTTSFLFYWIYKTYQPFFDTTKYTKHNREGITMKVLKNVTLNNAVEKVRGYMEHYETCFLGPIFLQVIRDPEDLKIVFNSEETFEKIIYNSFYFTYGLLSQGGELYKQQRKAISPLFNLSRLRNIAPIVNQNMTNFLDLYEKIRVPEAVDFNHIAAYFTLSSSLYTIFNIDIKDYETLAKSVTNLRNILENCNQRFMNPLMYSHFFFKHSPLGRKVWKWKIEMFKLLKLDQFKLSDDQHSDGMKFYYDHISNTKFDPNSEEYIDSTLLMVGASFDTSAYVLASTLLLLGMNPDKQDILYNELKSVLSSSGDKVTDQEMDKLPYLDLVIKESLRLLPVGAIIGRKVTSDLKLTRYTARAGSYVTMPMLEFHQDKSIWGEDALEFKPERFLKENMESIHPYAYFPFSKGPRMCPGYKHAIISMKIFVSRFLMKYRVSTALKYHELIFTFSMTMGIKQKHMMKVELRE